MRPLRIGVNALYLIPGGVGGTEIYLRSLLGAMASIESDDRFVVFVNAETQDCLGVDSSRFEFVQTGVRASNRPWRLAWEQLILPGKVRRHGIDVLFNPGFTAPAVSPCPTVTVFHDLQHKRHPEYFRWFDLPFWDGFLYASAHRSTMIIAVSHATGKDFMDHYRVDASRVRVVHHGVDMQFFGIRDRTVCERDGRYILTVSTLHPHKNFRRLLLAFAQFVETSPEMKLIIAGMRGFEASKIDALIGELGLQQSVTCTGWIPRDQLYRLFACAHAFIYPTTFEGFGMTLLEGLAAGLPVACSGIEPVKTLAGDAALLFNPLDTAEITQALARISGDEDLRHTLAAAGPKRACQFDWQKAAHATLDVLGEAASRPKS